MNHNKILLNQLQRFEQTQKSKIKFKKFKQMEKIFAPNTFKKPPFSYQHGNFKSTVFKLLKILPNGPNKFSKEK